MPTRFRFLLGELAGSTSDLSVAVGGAVRWGDGGWLVEGADCRYQAPASMGQAEAVLEWLRIRLGVAPVHVRSTEPNADMEKARRAAAADVAYTISEWVPQWDRATCEKVAKLAVAAHGRTLTEMGYEVRPVSCGNPACERTAHTNQQSRAHDV